MGKSLNSKLDSWLHGKIWFTSIGWLSAASQSAKRPTFFLTYPVYIYIYILAPAYANLFMTRLEERLLKASTDKPLVWIRFIDDVFLIWPHGEEKLKSLINHLNSSHETIKFTSEQSRDSISFLDVQVSVGEGGVLSTDLFCKPTDTHQYLHKKSCHPWHTKKAIPYGQPLRFRRIFSEDRQFQERVGELAGWLKDRGYEESRLEIS